MVLTLKGLRANSGYREVAYEAQYILMWVNFGAFCVHLLTQEMALQNLQKVFSGFIPIRHYCRAQMSTCWIHMRSMLQLTTEQVSYLIDRCMQQSLVVNIKQPTLCNKESGTFVFVFTALVLTEKRMPFPNLPRAKPV